MGDESPDNNLASQARTFLASLPLLPPLRPGVSSAEAAAWQLERQRRAALERVAEGRPVGAAGLVLLPAEIAAVLGEGDKLQPAAFIRPLSHDGRRDLRAGALLSGQPAAVSWAMKNALQRVQDVRRRDGVQLALQSPWAVNGEAGAADLVQLRPLVAAAPSPPVGVRTYPSLNLAAVKAQKAPLYRVWLYARLLDRAGRGWVMVDDLRAALAAKGGAMTWRWLRILLAEGEGTFWTFDNDYPNRLRYLGTAALAARLGLERLSGRPVVLAAAKLLGTIGDFKASLYATWHAGRAKEGRKSRPVSRQSIEGIAGVSASTQRRYDRRAGVHRRRNIAITGHYSQEGAQEQAGQHGAAVFAFDDRKGKQGRKGGRYLARALPNSYQVKNMNGAASGRQRKVNERLALLVPSRESGARARRVRLFFDDGAAACKAYNRDHTQDAFYKGNEGAVQIWYTLPAGPDQSDSH